MRFPKTIHYRRIETTIYGRRPNDSFYRISYYVAGKRVQAGFKTYPEAKAEAELKIREIAEGSKAVALNADQSRDALAALQRLETLRQSSGRRFFLLAAVSQFAESVDKLRGHTLDEAVEGFLRTSATITRKDLAEAVEEFIEGRKHLKPQTANGHNYRATMQAASQGG